MNQTEKQELLDNIALYRLIINLNLDELTKGECIYHYIIFPHKWYGTASASVMTLPEVIDILSSEVAKLIKLLKLDKSHFF